MEEIIFPNQIRMVRRTRGKTMKEIASVLNVSLSAISKIEKGYRRIDEDQLNKISEFLHCPKESIFVYEKTSQPEVLQAWEKEQERRKQINEKSGLKTLGAGLRYLRGEKMLTLQDVAKGAGLTLSVYHRIEMGQREVSEDQFQKIAHALGYAAEDLQLKIYELDMAGTLQEFKKTAQAGIFHPKGGYNDLPLRNLTFQQIFQLPLYQADKIDVPSDALTVNDVNKDNAFAVCVPLECALWGKFSQLKVVASLKEKGSNEGLSLLKKDGHFLLGSLDGLHFTEINQKGQFDLQKEELDNTFKVLALLP